MSKFNLFSKNNDSQEELNKLSKENEKMLHQIETMISKIKSLEIKTEELHSIINDLQNQKKHLTETIEKLEDLHKQKEDLIKIAAHDLKNPAGTIKNLIGLLETFDLTNQEQQEIHQSLINLADRIVVIVDDVVASVKKSKGLFELNMSDNNFNQIVVLTVKRYQAMAQKKTITMTSTIDSNIPEFTFDKTKIEEVVENLINNAIKFTPANCNVKVQTRKDKNYVVLEVTDNGPGLTANEAKKAFGKEVKLSNTPTGGESSSGLGLWIVRKFVEKHNGRVWIKSKKGVGSTFAFKIPIKQKED